MRLSLSGNNTTIGYTIFTGSFAPTFKETKDKINYLLDLGVNTVWFTPWVKGNSYHRYDAVDYYDVDPMLGTMEDLEDMINAFNEAGIKVIMDLVLCHTSNKHSWFDTNPEYYYIEKEKPNEDYLPDLKFGNCWKLGASRGKHCWYRAPFGEGMPALNLENKELRQEIRNIVAFWLFKGVKGFRLDAVAHSHPDREESINFWHWFRQEAKLLDPNMLLVGEAWEGAETVAHYSNAIGSCFNFDTAFTLINKIKQNNISWLSQDIKAINDKMKYARHYDAIFLSNHDLPRTGYHLKTLEQRKAAASFLLTLKGIPFIYYGEELGFATTNENGDKNIREAVNWNSVALHKLDENSLYNHYRSLIDIRKNSNALSHGHLAPISSSDENVCIFCRSFYNEEVIVAINLSGETKEFQWGKDKYKQLYQSEGISHKRGNNGALRLAPGTTILERV